MEGFSSLHPITAFDGDLEKRETLGDGASSHPNGISIAGSTVHSSLTVKGSSCVTPGVNKTSRELRCNLQFASSEEQNPSLICKREFNAWSTSLGTPQDVPAPREQSLRGPRLRPSPGRLPAPASAAPPQQSSRRDPPLPSASRRLPVGSVWRPALARTPHAHHRHASTSSRAGAGGRGPRRAAGAHGSAHAPCHARMGQVQACSSAGRGNVHPHQDGRSPTRGRPAEKVQ